MPYNIKVIKGNQMIEGFYYIGFYLLASLDVKDYYTDDVDVTPGDVYNYYVTRHYYANTSNVKDIAKIEDIVVGNPLYFTDKFYTLDVNDMDLVDY